MTESSGYAVFFFPQAIESLGDAIKPYLQDGPGGQHVVCNEIDTGGSLIEMTLFGDNAEGKRVALELMVPSGMVRMIVSRQSDALFGFGPHAFATPVAALPVAGPTAAPAGAPSEAVPASAPSEAVPVNPPVG